MGYVIVIPWLVRLYMFFPAESRRECQQKFTCLTRRNMISSTRPACLGNCYFFGQLDPGQKPTKVYQFSQRNMIPPASPSICPPDNSDPSRRRDPGRTPAEVYPIPGRNIARARPPARVPATDCLPAPTTSTHWGSETQCKLQRSLLDHTGVIGAF